MTHIAPPDADGNIINEPVLQEGQLTLHPNPNPNPNPKPNPNPNPNPPGVMGSDSPWRFFSLPNAWSAGFIPQSEIINWGGRNGVWVLMDRHRRLTLTPNP